MTAHECLWAYGNMPCSVQVGKYVSDYRLNERHYGALQGYVKADVEAGKYDHDPKDVQDWRRSWYAIPPLLEDGDERRVEEIRRFGNACGGEENVPRGESLEMVAKDRITPFLEEVLTPALDFAVQQRRRNNVVAPEIQEEEEGGTGLVVAHANSLRALIGVICNVEQDPIALSKLEQMKIQTGVPLVLRYKQNLTVDENGEVVEKKMYQACNLLEEETEDASVQSGSTAMPDLPVWPLASIPWNGKKRWMNRSSSSSSSSSLRDSTSREEAFIFDICPKKSLYTTSKR